MNLFRIYHLRIVLGKGEFYCTLQNLLSNKYLIFSHNFLACSIIYYSFNNIALKFKTMKKENVTHYIFERLKK